MGEWVQSQCDWSHLLCLCVEQSMLGNESWLVDWIFTRGWEQAGVWIRSWSFRRNSKVKKPLNFLYLAHCVCLLCSRARPGGGIWSCVVRITKAGGGVGRCVDKEAWLNRIVYCHASVSFPAAEWRRLSERIQWWLKDNCEYWIGKPLIYRGLHCLSAFSHCIFCSSERELLLCVCWGLLH